MPMRWKRMIHQLAANNITYLLATAEQNPRCRNASILCQDATMQRRMEMRAAQVAASHAAMEMHQLCGIRRFRQWWRSPVQHPA